mmetsp:Transcript_1665/g.6484  ORF Transcript_1665/g.6484 Transcript_1665/m.6484 type:complete len:207 (+) Transcript_1665:1699-2319(+)
MARARSRRGAMRPRHGRRAPRQRHVLLRRVRETGERIGVGGAGARRRRRLTGRRRSQRRSRRVRVRPARRGSRRRRDPSARRRGGKNGGVDEREERGERAVVVPGARGDPRGAVAAVLRGAVARCWRAGHASDDRRQLVQLFPRVPDTRGAHRRERDTRGEEGRPSGGRGAGQAGRGGARGRREALPAVARRRSGGGVDSKRVRGG